MVGKSSLVQTKPGANVIQYAHSAAVTAWTPIQHSVFGVLIAMVSAAINVSTQYYSDGVFRFAIGTGVSVAQGDILYYDTDSDFVVKIAPTNGFLLGVAVAAGTATAGYVDVMINQQVSKGNQITAGKLTVNGGQVAAKFSGTDIGDTAPTLTAAQVLGGIIYGTIVSARTATLCDATSLAALIPGFAVGTSVMVTFINNGADTDALTVACPASITNKGLAGHLTVAQNAARTYRIVFTSATAADLFPMS